VKLHQVEMSEEERMGVIATLKEVLGGYQIVGCGREPVPDNFFNIQLWILPHIAS